MSKESEFLIRVQETFKAEAEGHHSTMLKGLLELEKGGNGTEGDRPIIESMFREAHSLKGAARAVDMIGIEQVCQSIESVFSALKQAPRRLDKRTFEALYRALDLIAGLLRGNAPALEREMADVLVMLDPTTIGQDVITTAREERPAEAVSLPISPMHKVPLTMSETVRVSAKRLGSIFLHAEEMLSLKLAMTQHAADFLELEGFVGSLSKEWAKAGPAIKRLSVQCSGNASLRKILDFLEWHKAQDRAARQKLDKMWAAAAQDSLHAGERVEGLLTEIRAALLLPFSSLLEIFPRMVRDLAAEERKEVKWETRGEDTRIDRRVLEEIKDPLIHIVRNSISHGIESPGEREKKAKPRAGTIRLSVEQADKEKIVLTVSDDGAGIDLDRVKSAAIARAFLTAADAAQLSEAEVTDLIFLPELSTSPMITDIAGRGLGLAIAREKIEGIGGEISVETATARGTSLHIQIPLTLATFRGVMIRTGGESFVIPTASVDRVLHLDPTTIVFLEGQKCIPLDARAVSLVNLADVLGLEEGADHEPDAFRRPVIVLLVAGTRVAFMIDDVLGEQEVLVKTLGRQLARVRNLSGATVLSTGEVVPILNPSDLMRSVTLAAGRALASHEVGARTTAVRRILVAEDSVTSRMLLKSILEAAGYEVQTAVDGVEAFTALRDTEFDLLVSDIEMPRMSGLALCREVRGFPRTANLPVVLVTTLDSREDRERGIDAGANAYLVKSSFDQTNLLEVIKRLV